MSDLSNKVRFLYPTLSLTVLFDFCPTTQLYISKPEIMTQDILSTKAVATLILSISVNDTSIHSLILVLKLECAPDTIVEQFQSVVFPSHITLLVTPMWYHLLSPRLYNSLFKIHSPFLNNLKNHYITKILQSLPIVPKIKSWSPSQHVAVSDLALPASLAETPLICCSSSQLKWACSCLRALRQLA